ncbi:MAG TPA: biotin--[acetyl-CoA-carboxylase] ligase [Thermoanaerobaculia bacterium]|nr:biotin--[acetyl-CoA-carboxylase] ligase [Thermoanaerobaculia bacterium]
MIGVVGGSLEPERWQTLENCVCLHAVPSSNGLAREIIDVYFEEGLDLRTTVLVAEAQPGAYGRQGRRWEAPAGRGLYFTVLRPAVEGEPLSLVPIAAARWTRAVLAEKTGAPIALKWPNDLYVGRRKLGGVIAESRTQGGDTAIAVGVGINVLGKGEALGLPEATTLEEETGRPTPLAALLQAILDRFDRELSAPRWSEEAREWERVAAHRPGDRLTIHRNGEEISGAYLGLDASGFLRLDTGRGETTVATGEVAAW